MQSKFTSSIILTGLLLLVATEIPAQFIFDAKKLSKRKQAKVDKHPLGSEDNPVRCAHPEGERAYLDRLRCESGEPPEYERSGSVGEGPYGAIMDRYVVTCPGEETKRSIYMDMYHAYV